MVEPGSVGTVGIAIGLVVWGAGTTSVPDSSAGKLGEDFTDSAEGNGCACHVSTHPACPAFEPRIIRTLATDPFSWRSLIAVPRGTVKREPRRVNLLSLVGCCESSRAVAAFRPSTMTDPFPSKRRTSLDRGDPETEVDSLPIVVFGEVDVGSVEALGLASGSVVGGAGTTSVSGCSAGKLGADFTDSAGGNGRACFGAVTFLGSAQC